ncbi:MAG: metallophosphoesterase [Candidatus Caldarchaeum sp.]|nr:metallophosphoesterase [Candidatus Caldarchaeum sp.]
MDKKLFTDLFGLKPVRGRLSLLRRQLYRELVSAAVREGFQLTEKALQKLETYKNPHQTLYQTIEKIKRTNPDTSFIDADQITAAEDQPSIQSSVLVVHEPPPHIPEFETSLSVDENIKVDGELQEFQKLFTSRYHEIRKILAKRRIEFIPVSELAALREGGEAALAVMVLDKHEGKNSLRLEVDDPSGQVNVLASKKNQQLYNSALELLTDVVVGMKVKRVGDIYLLTEIIYPEVDETTVRQTSRIPESYVCLISDVHVGSKHFRNDFFENFLDWLNRGKDGVVKRITHLIIGGDLVEGIGVYPGQEKDLEIRNVEDQLKAAAKILAQIPARIEVVFSPGNHEPVRKALPQPPLPARYREILNRGRNIVHVSNPAEILFDGRRIVVYHGQGLDEIIQSLPSVSYSTLSENATEVVSALLKYRHLAPIYGGNTQLLPLKEDKLVLAETPHLLQTGHIHVLVNKTYHGVKLVNAGAWQEQTDYQKALGLEPAVGHAAVVNISNMAVEIRNFAA